MNLDIDRCIIKQVWCGDSSTIPKKDAKKYSKVGTKLECLKKGFGAGSSVEKRKGLSSGSLQNIPYVGDAMEINFKKRFISTISDLVKKTKPMSAANKKAFLKSILINKTGTLNSRAYNSVILFLHNKGMANLPQCVANA